MVPVVSAHRLAWQTLIPMRTAGPDLQQAFPNRIGLRPGRSITVGRGEPDFRSVGMPRGLGLKTWEARVWAAPPRDRAQPRPKNAALHSEESVMLAIYRIARARLVSPPLKASCGRAARP